MRKKIVAGNWKMNKTLEEGLMLTEKLLDIFDEKPPKVAIPIICPPFIHVALLANVLEDSIIGVGAQNCSAMQSGAYTGEVSAKMLKSADVQYVILGHSERRAIFGETNELVGAKVKIAISEGLNPIFCCGETLEERKSGQLYEVIKNQLIEGVLFLKPEEFKQVIVAYEPVWAIGTGLNATPEQAKEMHVFIRNLIKETYGERIAQETSILYGGSCKPDNARDLFSIEDVDGGLIGGASLDPHDFSEIIFAFE